MMLFHLQIFGTCVVMCTELMPLALNCDVFHSNIGSCDTVFAELGPLVQNHIGPGLLFGCRSVA